MILAEIAKYDAEIQTTIGLFLDNLACEPGQRVNATDWIAMLAYDLMGVIGFSRDFGSLRAGKKSAAITGLHSAMRALAVLFAIPWLINMLSNLPGTQGAGPLSPLFAYCTRLLAEKRSAKVKKAPVESQQQPTDVISWLIRAFEEGGPAAAPSLAALNSDSRVLVIGGA